MITTSELQTLKIKSVNEGRHYLIEVRRRIKSIKLTMDGMTLSSISKVSWERLDKELHNLQEARVRIQEQMAALMKGEESK